MKVLKLLLVLMTISSFAFAQQTKTKNIIIVTLDGYRWQELFEGADPKLLSDPKMNNDRDLAALIKSSPAVQKREHLMPFFWTVIAKQGQLYGNRNYGNTVNCANHRLLSYPGYSEMLVGHPEKKVKSNRKEENPNATVLEYINRHGSFRQKVAAFATWDAFPFILRKEKSEIHVNAGKEIAKGQISLTEEKLNELQQENDQRLDHYTFKYAMEYLKREKPRVMFIGFDETDAFAHQGQYDRYLNAAHEADKRIGELWNWIQSQPEYKDQTTLFITTDHGRGTGKRSWKKHQLLTSGSRHIWFAVIGPDTPAFGELKFQGKYYQKQVAKTIAAFLGVDYKPSDKTGEIIQTMIAAPQNIENDTPSITVTTQDTESLSNP